ncbi:hypothetical protein [Sinorhizobium sp. 7-81]|uniref:hypothetical protein n=1 Tax=Sinorhizobium sp. 7-81 TaxID=3049087 RepID=UPI00301437D1
MKLEIFSLRARPDLIPAVFSKDLNDVWPEFIRHDPTTKLYFGSNVFSDYLDYAFAAIVDDEVVGRAFSVPFAFGIQGRTELPDGGWDQVIRWAHEDRLIDRTPTTMSALEVTLSPKARGIGNALSMLGALKECARKMGFVELSIPVRPTQKHLYPQMPMSDYIKLRREDGSPFDSWLRAHSNSGGKIDKVASYSMTIVGTVAEWSQWTEATIQDSGMINVEGALVPVLISMEQDLGIYVEPNVWVRHSL